ncbi:hypothetical protein SDC9_187873 [bioreactor metagenome]|uniref:Uncharacterized protein n=1 Tax=bioreactor metagenome TaxID=1076179 RepID=A0A645HN05_9ZZZZ|nr:DUF6506 family protein [Lachnospiraceae bacterium]
MEDKLNAAFIFLAGGTTKMSRAVVETGTVNLHAIGVGSYKEACEEAVKLKEMGVTAIELCAGFGNEGIAMIAKAVGKDVAVGAVKFDFHPALGFKSGDEFFN